MILDNLFTCLRGTALQWYTSELSTNQKVLVKYGEGIVKWEKQLLRWFRIAPNQAMIVITNEKYTIDDARRWREPREYSTKIIRAARDAKLLASLNIFSLVYNSMDAEFQRDLLLPTAMTLIDRFLQIMEEKKTV